MKIFLDTADIDQIKKFSFIIDGVTPNPSLIAKIKPEYPFEELIMEISKIVQGPISVEIMSRKSSEMVEEAKQISRISPNIVIKVPMTMEGLKATKRLKKAGFKIGYHLMPGIPGSNLKKDMKMFKEIFSSENYRPDQLKIYPCQVLKGSALEKLYYKGKYSPYSNR